MLTLTRPRTKKRGLQTLSDRISVNLGKWFQSIAHTWHASARANDDLVGYNHVGEHGSITYTFLELLGHWIQLQMPKEQIE